MDEQFKISTHFQPCGDQAKAISFLSDGVGRDYPHQVLLGVTGSGKTFTMAKVIEQCQRPALVIAHNKTLAAQLYREFKKFFPSNAVHYFVSYYDYYQPEAYIPTTDTYIEKDSSINDELDKLRHAATRSILERRDVIIVASVSCIYGLGAPSEYAGQLIKLQIGQKFSRRQLLERLVELQYNRNDAGLSRGKFRVRGDIVEVFGTGEDDVLRVEFFGDQIETLTRVDPLRNTTREKLRSATIFPASHYVTSPARRNLILNDIRVELKLRLKELDESCKLLEKQRLSERTEFDLEMLELTGYCSGIENYSRYLTGRSAGEAPPTLIDYLPKDALVFIDESHVTLPQIQAMYRGDYSRKRVLIDYGFRLPSALDNRPLKFEEFQEAVARLIYVSATPGKYEFEKSKDRIVEQITRPTGLLDPLVEVRESTHQVDDLLEEIRLRAVKGERTLVTTLTKKLSEDLTGFYLEQGIKAVYLHSEIDTLARTQIIRELRTGKYDVLIGVNLLREGLDIPEVSLVAILDADQEGFLRSTTSLIQTIGRCARHVDAKALLYANTITRSMKAAIEETERRRELQKEYNQEMGIQPKSIQKEIDPELLEISQADYMEIPAGDPTDPANWSLDEFDQRVQDLQERMRLLAEELKFEEAAKVRDLLWNIQSSNMHKHPPKSH